MDKLDIKLWSLASKGQIVPDRSLLKTPEQIEKIKKSAELNTAVLDHVAKHIHIGMSTADIDKLVYDFTVSHGEFPLLLATKVSQKAYALPSTTLFVMVFQTKTKFLKKETLST